MAHEDDKRTRTLTAALHLINQASLDELCKQVRARYPDGLEDFFFGEEQFRANLCIDWPEAYAEDQMLEMRAGPILFRMAGPCIRCNTVRLNMDKHCRVGEMEPLSTLGATRMLKGFGACFGTYLQPDILASVDNYDHALADVDGYPSALDVFKRNILQQREGDSETYCRFFKEDGIRLRLLKELPWVSQLSQRASSN